MYPLFIHCVAVERDNLANVQVIKNVARIRNLTEFHQKRCYHAYQIVTRLNAHIVAWKSHVNRKIAMSVKAVNDRTFGHHSEVAETVTVCGSHMLTTEIQWPDTAAKW